MDHNGNDERRFSKRLTMPEPVLLASWSFPPLPGGSAIIVQNLITGFSNDSIVLATSKPRSVQRPADASGSYPRHFVWNESNLPGRWERLRKLLLRPLVTSRLLRIARRHRCGAVVGVYPNLQFLDASERAARRLGLPFIPYLHDTVAEALSSSRFAPWARATQRRVFASARRILVATQGMDELYRAKYGLETIPLVHIYPEPVPSAPPSRPARKRSLFWGGGVYSINSGSLLRVQEAGVRVDGLKMTIATGQAPEEVHSLGFEPGTVEFTYVPVEDRPRYLQLLADHEILVLALNWPDETHVHEQELATIFPTKTPEYLASGRPIVVHCPAHYHLARFFVENGCGVVVSDRDTAAVEAALSRILGSAELRYELATNALKAVEVFAPNAVRPVFRDLVCEVLRGSG